MASLQWRTTSTTGAPTFARQPHLGRPISRAIVRVHASFVNPHSILGVSATADVKEVKRAYRKLALQFHPDVCKSEDGHERFMALTQAYEMLLGRAEGKTDPNHASSTSWDFHDWYWNFRMQRSWEKQQRQAKAAAAADADAEGDDDDDNDGAAAADPDCGGGRHSGAKSSAGFQQPEARANLRSQLAGLRHRAAVRANRPAAAAPCCSMDSTTEEREEVSATAAGTTAAGAKLGGLDAKRAGSGSVPPAPEGESHPKRNWSWSWSWSWDETLESDEEVAAAAADLHSQYTHVYDAAAGDVAGAPAGWPVEPMAVQDGHLGTVVVANHAVPFPSGLSSAHKAPPPQQQQQQQHMEEQQSQSQQPQRVEVQAQGEREESGRVEEPEPEPFSNPYEQAPPHARGRRAGFNADSSTREAVSHQLTGLRRKAAIKVQQWGARGGGGAN